MLLNLPEVQIMHAICKVFLTNMQISQTYRNLFDRSHDNKIEADAC